MRKSILAAAVASVPLVVIAAREAIRLFAGLSDPRQASAAPILWIFGVFVTLTCLWAGVFLVGRVSAREPVRLPFEATAAIAIAEARKRPLAEKCSGCGRTRLILSASKCLYCGAAFGVEPVTDGGEGGSGGLLR